MRQWDAEKESQLLSDISTMDADIAEASKKLQEYEGKSLDDAMIVGEE